jgi:hypothetical protein
MTAAYHPQADGLAERKNQSVEIALRFWIFDHPGEGWLSVIPLLQWNLNSGYSAPIKSSPHEQLFGFKPAGPLDALAAPAALTKSDKDDIAAAREALRQDAQLAMDFASAYAKRRYDKEHRDIEFSVGDKVFLRLHHGYHLPGKPPRKLSQQRAGPFVIKRRVGRLAYELDLPENMTIHPVISVAHLIPAPPGDDPFDRVAPPPRPVEDSRSDRSTEDSEPGDSYEVEIVLQHRVVRKRYQYLIKWKDCGHEHNVWKTVPQLRHSRRLIKEYWARRSEEPPTEALTEPRRPAGDGTRRRRRRQRKNTPPMEDLHTDAKDAKNAKSLKNAISGVSTKQRASAPSALRRSARLTKNPDGGMD